MNKGSKREEARQEGKAEEGWEDLGQAMGAKCFGFVRPLLRRLDAHLDVRLVRTVANLVPVLVQRRGRADALLLSQLGDALERAGHGPAGTKRVENLLRSAKWQASEVGDFLGEQARALVSDEAARVPEGRALVILDGTVEEKPESAVLEGLAPVNSAKGRRLRRPRPKLGPGYWRGKPGPPTVVPGWTCVRVVVTGWAERTLRRPVGLGAALWYRRVGREHPDHAAVDAAVPTADAATAAAAVLRPFVAAIGVAHLLFVGDREYANLPWLTQLIGLNLPFVVRFKKGNHLRPEDAPSVSDPLASPTQCQAEGRPAWRLTQTLLFRQTRTIANPRDPQHPIPVRFGARPVRLVGVDEPLWLVWVKVGKGGRRRRVGEPWRLLTSLPVETDEDVWRVVEAYAARWQIEQTIRFTKSELGIESVRVRAWEPRAKLLAVLTLAYAFLTWLLGDGSTPLVARLLSVVHRRGRQAREAWRPLYRLRQALAFLWKRHTPSFQGVP